jgi:hypothetical protein
MDSGTNKPGFRPEAAFSDAAARFLEMMKSFGVQSGARAPDWSALAGPLAGQFEQWLRMSQLAGPWFGTGPPAAGVGGFGPSAPWSFGPLPIGPAATQSSEAQRSFELLARLAELQGQLTAHWSEIAQSAARRFVARLGTGAAVPTSTEQALKLYQLWVASAEEAYAATVHKPDFARLQAEVANTSAALLVEQRKHAETLVRAFGLPTRSEVDALYDQVKNLRRELAELAASATTPAPAPRTTTARAKPPTPRGGARRGRAGRSRR